MGKTFWENWVLGPHDPESRSPVGSFFWWLVNSDAWEMIFLMYILFNAALKLTDLRIQPLEWDEFLLQNGLIACIIFNAEWLIEILSYGVSDFFADTWYQTDTFVNVMNWGSYAVSVKIIGGPLRFVFANIAFVRMLRFLKPLGRVRFLFPSKVVVKTVAGAMASMGPVLSLVGFAVLFFGIVGIFLFGKEGQLYYRCGNAFSHSAAAEFYDQRNYEQHARSLFLVAECHVNVAAFEKCWHLHPGRAVGLHHEVDVARVQEDAVNEGVAQRRNLWTGYGLKRDRDTLGDGRLRALVDGENVMNPDNITDFELHCSNQDLGPGGYNLSCITTVPQEHCWCKSTNPEEIIGTCMHPNCGEGLCFKTAVSPVSDLHGFSHMGKAGLTVIALMFQKNWSEMMDLCVQAAGAMFGYTYYFLVVIFGSFCLLNLTVATVGQTYTRVKKLSEAKKAKKEAEIAQREKIQAERDEMKEKQRAEKKAAGGDEDDEDDADEVDLLFDQVRARLYWGLGLVGVPFAHRIYFKGWYEGWFFVLRCVTLNYFYVGWIIDGLALDTVNQVASEAEVERRQVAIDKRKEHLDSEISRIESLMLDPQIMKLSVFLSYPTKDFPCMYSREVLENQYNKFKAENPKAFPASETDVGNMDDLAGLEDDDSEESSEGGEDVETSTSEEGGQSHFAWFADFVVIANAGTLAMTGFNDHWNPLLEAVGYFASIFFIVEAMVKSKAYGGWSYYLTDSSNVFDFTLVVIPTIGEVTTLATEALFGRADFIYQALALQALRVFRIGKLTKHLVGLKRLTAQAFGSPEGVIYAMAVTIVFIVFYSLFGNELFKSSIAFAMRRNDYQYPLEAMKAMIEFLFGESYYENLRIGSEEQDVVGIFYFVVFFYVANFLVLRMFIALILENFEFTEDQRACLQIQLFQRTQVLMNDLIDGKAKTYPLDELWGRLRKQNLDEDQLRDFQNRWRQVVVDRAAEQGETEVKAKLWDIIIAAEARKTDVVAALEGDRSALMQLLNQLNQTVRAFVYDLVENKNFNLFVAAAIIFSVVLLQIDPPEDPIMDPSLRQTIDRSLLIFFTTEVSAKMYAFGTFSQALPVRRTFEFPQGKPPFFSNTEEGGWNALDFIFIGIMMIDVLTPISLGNFKTIRIVRIVRPLQKNIPTVKNLLAALFASFVSILHVINLLVLLMLIFGLMGVSLFRGRLHRCNDNSKGHFRDCIGTNFGGFPAVHCDFMDPLHPNGTLCEQEGIGSFIGQQILVPVSWDVPSENFENIGAASMTLLRFLAADNVRGVFNAVMDIPEQTEIVCSNSGLDGSNGCEPWETQYVVAAQPESNSMPENIMFPIVYIFIANAFISQLVIGVLIDNIRRQSGTALYTETQRIWWATGVTMGRLSLKAKPKIPTQPLRKFLYLILISDIYDSIMMVIIVVNTLWMATEHYPAPHIYNEVKVYIDNFFIIVYLLETIAKLFSFGVIDWERFPDTPQGKLRIWSPYFSDSWNSFDFLVVLMSVVDGYFLPKDGPDLSVFKLLRVLRVFRLVKKIKTLQVMIGTLLGAVPSILSALFFLAIWIFIFASVGTDKSMFEHLKHGKVISSRWNFETTTNSILLLFRVATGDAWFDLIYDASITAPYCTSQSDIPEGQEHLSTDCGLQQISYIYFIIYYAGCTFINLPLFVATLIDYFFEAQVDVQSLFNADACELYSQTWSEFDDSGCGFTSIENLRPLIERLEQNGSEVGFRVSSDMSRFKNIWARVMTNPLYFPPQGLTVSEDEGDVERLGLRVIDRNNILKAFGNSARAVAIRQYVYKKTEVKEKREVQFKYAAKCMVIFMPGLQKPLTSADLVNRGAGLQSFMGLLGQHEVSGRDGGENLKWMALEVHNQLVKPVDARAKADDGEDHSDFDVKELGKIIQAQAIVRKELRPPHIPGEEPPLKPTGDKREALVNKINAMQEEFEKMADGLVQEIMWGTSDNEGIVDVLLDNIISQSVENFARHAVGSIAQRFDAGNRAKSKTPHALRYTSTMLERKAVEPVITTIPRGWLNSQRPIVRKRLQVGAVMRDATQDSLAALTRLAPRPPAPPSRAESISSAAGAAPRGVQRALDSAMTALRQEDAWQQAAAHDFGGAAPAGPKGVSWRLQYQYALDGAAARMAEVRAGLRRSGSADSAVTAVDPSDGGSQAGGGGLLSMLGLGSWIGGGEALERVAEEVEEDGEATPSADGIV